MLPFKYSLRSLTVRRSTTLASAFGLGLVVFVLSSATMLSNGIERTLGRSGDADAAVVVRRGANAETASVIDAPDVAKVIASDAVRKLPDGRPDAVAELVVVMLVEKVGASGVSNLQIRGVPEGAFAFRKRARIIAGRQATPGTDEVIVGKAIAGRFQGVHLGGSFDLGHNRPASVVGVFADGGSSYESEVWADMPAVQSAFGRDGLVSSVRVRLASESKLDALKTTVDQTPSLALTVHRETDFYEKQSEGTSLFIQGMGTVIAVLFSVGAMIGATITMHAAVAARRREVGTLRALGFSRVSILASFMLEAMLLSLFGGGVGALASLSMSFVTFTTVSFATWSETVFTFEPTPGILGSAMLVAAVMGALGGFLPALRAARMSPLTAMRG